jgi:putative transposase
MRYRFVAAERATFPVRMLCRIVGVAVSGFYAWLRRWPGRREEDRRVSERIGAIFAASRGTYGSPRVHAELRAEGVRVGRKRVARLMREGGLAVARRRRRVPRTTDSRHDHPVAPDLLGRAFTADRPDTVWLADLSYIPTGEGWLYLAAIKDMATREIVGWSRPITSGPSWRATPCGWPCSGGSRRRGSSIIPTVAGSTRAGPIG